MYLIEPIALLWATVSKETTGPAVFFSESETPDCALNSVSGIAHPQCL